MSILLMHVGLQHIMYNHGMNAVEFEYNTRS